MKSAETVDTLAALAHETRLKVYRALEAAGPDGLPAGALADKLDMAASSLSSHLGILSRAGIVSPERRGRSIIYRSRPERVKALARMLVQG